MLNNVEKKNVLTTFIMTSAFLEMMTMAGSKSEQPRRTCLLAEESSSAWRKCVVKESGPKTPYAPNKAAAKETFTMKPLI